MPAHLDRPYWVVDVSNSFTKLALVKNGVLGEVQHQPTPRVSLSWIKKLASLPIALSSVVPKVTQRFREACLGHPLEILTGENAAPLLVNYPQPTTIGADRLANALALRELFGAPGVVLDFGTAVTFDVLDPQGAYCGGVIAPGLNAMTDYLHERTALLPRVTLREPQRAIAKSTEEAICVGAMLGYRGLIREVLQAICDELCRNKKSSPFRVIATGGQAEVVTRSMPEIETVLPNLTLEGVRLWAHPRMTSHFC